MLCPLECRSPIEKTRRCGRVNIYLSTARIHDAAAKDQSVVMTMFGFNDVTISEEL